MIYRDRERELFSFYNTFPKFLAGYIQKIQINENFFLYTCSHALET